MIWIILIGICIIVLFITAAYFQRTKCPHCKSRKVTATQQTELYTEPVLFKENVKIKEYDNKNNHRSEAMLDVLSDQYLNPPKKIITQEVVVQGERIWYNVQYRCNKCHKDFSQKEYRDIKPEIIK